jgi:hypothetical protein
MSTIEIKAYELFKSKFGEKEADTFIEYIHSVSNETSKTHTTKEENIKSETSVKEEIRRLDVKISEEIGRLDVKISETKNDLIKWLFGFWITLVGLILVNWFLK